MTSTEKKDKTPDSVGAREKAARDDDAVSKSVNTEGDAKYGTTSVLPGPPIPPEIQEQVRNERQTGDTATGGSKASSPRNQRRRTSMIDSADIKEHMEVVGSDGEHVGTVDRCEGAEAIKLTKNDPAAGGRHHFIPMAWVERVDDRVHLAPSGNEARSHWG